MDCDANLYDPDSFLSVDVNKSEDSLSMVNALIIIQPSIPSLQEIAYALQAAWTKIAFNEFQATSIRWYEEATVFRFVTGVPNSGLGFTGTFIATGNDYSRLVDQFRTGFGNVGSRIERFPGGLPPWATQLR